MASFQDTEERLKAALASRYRIEREVGSGGWASVYLAQDVRHDRRVAVKVLRPELAAVLGPDRFLQEIKIAAKLTHPHILPLYDSGETDGFLYFVMPYIEGESLRARLAEKGTLPTEEAARILRDVVDALAEAHRNGVVHRDIKPENVMLRGHHALVADFGVAKAVSEVTGRQQLTTAGVALGTPAYMAPEQAGAEGGVDHRADLYSVGVLGYEMLSGRAPFEGSSFASLLVAKLEGHFDPLDGLRDGLPGPLVGAIHRCLSREPDDRWGSAEELLRELELLVTPAAGLPVRRWTPAERRRRFRRLGYTGVISVAAVTMVVTGLRFLEKRREVTSALNEGIPEIQRLRDLGELGTAFARALEAKAVLGGLPALDTVLATFTDTGTIRSVPSGAEVWWGPYGSEEEDLVHLGVTPLVTLVPRTYSDFRVELEGYQSQTAPSYSARFSGQFTDFFGGPIHLPPEGSVPGGMVFIPGGETPLHYPGLEGEEPVELGPYYLDRTEVTNREYKDFLDGGGYQDPQWWVHPFVEGNDTLNWDEAVARFTDRTGRPGPSTWEAGDYPRGMDEYPVGGISWFEAGAYAEFRGKALPTIFHWSRALDAFSTNFIAPRSVFGSQGPRPVGESGAMSLHGNYDMGGNVREWCLNGSGGLRFTLGGGWNDAQFMFNHSYPQSPWDRFPTNGLRLADYGSGEPNLEKAGRNIHQPFRDFRSLTPVSDETFEAYRGFFAYDRTPLNARQEAVDTTRDWIRERVSFDAGYENDRVVLYLFIPRSSSPPYQPVIYYPGSGAIFIESIDDDFQSVWEFIVKTGRALIFPVYWSTFERRAGLTTDQPDSTTAYRERVVRWSKDFRRSLDWAETRPELDFTRLGFYGFSWGARLGPLMLALEPRVKAAVLNVGGLKFQPTMPEGDPFNFAPRVRIPVLMMNGELDHIFPLETSSRPLFELLGTPDSLKLHVIEEGGHLLRQDQVISQALAWYDRFLGHVR